MRISDWSSDVCSSDLSTGRAPAAVYYCPPWQSGPATGLAAGRPPPAKEFRMSDAGATDRRLSDRLAHVQEALRSLLARTTDQAVLEGIEAAALELGLIRLGLDAPSPRSRSEEHTSELQSLMRISFA